MSIQSNKLDNKCFFLFLGLIASVLSVYVALKVNSFESSYIPLSLFALIMGLFVEYKRISKKWSYVLYLTLGCIFLGFFSLLAGKEEGAKLFDRDIIIFPLGFCFFFILLAAIIHENDIIPKLTEGFTLLLSISLLYFLFDSEFWHSKNIIAKPLLLALATTSTLSIIFTISNIHLSKLYRLFLSIWTSVIMMILAFDNAYNVYLNKPIEATNYFWEASYIGTQYFLLGVASIHMAQNIFMIMGFIPGKGVTKNDIINLKNKHILRYSSQQIKMSHGILCIVFTSFIFSLNYYFDIVPRSFVIWLAIIFFPEIVALLTTKDSTIHKENTIEQISTNA